MKTFYLSLGSNLGDRFHYLNSAVEKLKKKDIVVLKTSSVYETPALLKTSAPEEWNKPFLNLAVKAKTSYQAQEVLTICKEIETQLGRKKTPAWSPRAIDIDILLFDQKMIYTQPLKIPHPEMLNRNFVLAPLKELNPCLNIPGQKSTVLNLSRKLNKNLPCWMQIINITPDSFSDGGKMNFKIFEQILKKTLIGSMPIIDLGAESTRPAAQTLEPKKEWSRLAPYIDFFFNFYKGCTLRPRLSIDTYHPETAEKAIARGADIINDVSGFSEKMLQLLSSSSVEYVLTHSLSVPADPKKTLSSSVDPVAEIKTWFKRFLPLLEKHKIDKNRIIFDPGIGFGKTAGQSLILLQRARDFLDLPVRILIGHSRKSFMKSFSCFPAEERDLESFGCSVRLAGQGVDILRVHSASEQARVFLAYSSLLQTKQYQ